jgi:hypothetical protein
MPAALPHSPDLQHLKKQAKDLLRACQAGDPSGLAHLREHLSGDAGEAPSSEGMTLHDAQTVVARIYGRANWAQLRAAVAAAAAKAPSFDSLDERLRRHIDRLGFPSVGAYRRWCHTEGFGAGLDKSDGQLYDELAHYQTAPARPALRRDYRPSEARRITQAYRGETDGLWAGYREPFEGVDDPPERAALHRLLIHCLKYAPIGAPAVWQLARHHADWLRPVEEWIPQGRNEQELLRELTGFLLGRDRLPTDDGGRRAPPTPAERHAEVRGRRPTVLSDADIEQLMEQGWVVVHGAIPPDATARMVDRLWTELQRQHGFVRHQPETWNLPGWSPDRPPQSWTMLRLNRCKEDPVWDEMATPRLREAIEEVAPTVHVDTLARSGGAYVPAFPSPETVTPWDLPTRWSCYGHPDVPWPLGRHALLTQVTAQAGACLAVSGSHRLLRDFHATLTPVEQARGHKELVTRFYQSHPWLAELTGRAADRGDRVRRFMEETTVVDGVPLRVVAWTGEPGDVVLFHRGLVLARSRNLTASPVFTRG